MTKPLLACFLIGCLSSCTFTTEKKGQLFVNQKFIESEIQSAQPASDIEMSVQTTNGHDSMLIVKLEVDPKIPEDSLNAFRAKQVLGSFITTLPDLKTFISCKIIFIRKTGSTVSTSKSVEFICPMTSDLVTKVANFKDSTRASLGYIDTGWTYVNKDLNLSLPLKKDWYYMSEEQDSLVYYAIGSDVNQLPQYRTDTDRKVNFKSLYNLDPGEARPLLQICKYNSLSATTQKGKTDNTGPEIYAGMVINRFNSEDEYLKSLNEIFLSKKLAEKDIHTYRFGNTDFRGVLFIQPLKKGARVQRLSVIKQFRSVSLVMGMTFSTEKELEEIKQELNNLKIN